MGVGILCSGGDCAGMNAAIRRFVDSCYMRGEEPYFIYDGLEGMIDGNIRKAYHTDVAGILYRGGTIIRSSRSRRFYEKRFREKAYNELVKHGIDALVVLGGDGSFRALKRFYDEFGVRFVGIPSTIDNDIFGTEYCMGVDTALNVIRSSLDNIRDTAASFRRAFVIEVMGKECGYLAIVSAITSGAEVCIVPELEYDLDRLGKKLKDELKHGRNYILAIVAEGAQATEKVAMWLENDVKIDTRVSVLGHIQRGGNPTVYDRLMGFEFVEHGLNAMLNDGVPNGVVTFRGGSFYIETIDYVTSHQYRIKEDLLNLAKKMTGAY